jgi:hypothetical protein
MNFTYGDKDKKRFVIECTKNAKKWWGLSKYGGFISHPYEVRYHEDFVLSPTSDDITHHHFTVFQCFIFHVLDD